MREFKFRVWENGTMYYQVRCGGIFDGIPTAPTCWNENEGNWFNLTGQPHTVIMQYTGLKDKNGAEIYEGDILSNGEHINWIVFYDEGSFKVKLTNPYVNDNWSLSKGEGLSREIVGNIYQNPELVELW